jgi:hypothetical protein
LKYNEIVHNLFIDFKKVMYNILIRVGVLMKLVRLIKMYLNETYSKVRVDKYY